MPVVSMFYGIIVKMHWSDHNPPHVHAEYQGYKASILLDGALSEGGLPKKQLKLVQAWLEIHHDELEANWKLAQSKEQLFKIEPLR